ncbi:unnamed protein product [Peniophora sp. CBMAI 1063]|nr:unnamed protein product [Peniophora sp. CBMAI 1063]
MEHKRNSPTIRLPAPKPARLWSTTIREDGWHASSVGRVSAKGRLLNLDVVSLIMRFLLPTAEEAPVHDFKKRRYVVPAYIGWLTQAMCVSRAWYSTALHTCELWGILLASARQLPAWSTILGRAHAAPLRLYYWKTLHWPDLDALLDRASAVYAGLSGRTRNWTLYLQGRRMPHLEVLSLEANYNLSPDRPLPSCTSPLEAPRIRHITLYTPLVVKAGNVESASLANFTVAQMVDFLSELSTLRHVELSRPCFVGGIDWTRTFTQAGSRAITSPRLGYDGHWERLRVLTIHCRRGESYPLTSDAVSVSTPQVVSLDLTGPLLLAAPRARDLRIQDIYLRDLLRMLHGMPALKELNVVSLRGRTVWDFTDSLPSNPVPLSKLHKLTLKVGAHCGSLELLASIRAEKLAEISFACDASAPPNRWALQRVAEVLNDALPGDFASLRRAMEDARTGLWSAGYPGITTALNTEIEAAYWWNGSSYLPAPNALDVYRSAAELVRDMALATHEQDPPLHVGHRVRDIVLYALRAMTLDLKAVAFSRLEIITCYRSIQFDVEVTGGKSEDETVRKVRCVMVGPSFTSPNAAEPPQLPPLDSVAYGTARILHGLAVLPIREILVKNYGRGPFETLKHSNVDLVELSHTLARYSSVTTLGIEIGGSSVHAGLLRAISNPQALPSLSHLSVVHPTSVGMVSDQHPDPYHEWWDELEVALRRRWEAGRSLSLSVAGRFCLERDWSRRCASVVHDITVDVFCEHRVGVCCTRSD